MSIRNVERRLTGPAGFVRQLLEGQTKAAVSLPLKRRKSPGGAPRLLWIAEAVKKDALGWLGREGGWRSRQVVAGGRRREGRVWHASIFPALGVRFSDGPLHLLLAAMLRDDPIPGIKPALKQRVTANLGGQDPATGDLLALHRIVSALQAGSARGGRRSAGPRCPGCDAPLEAPSEKGEAPAEGRRRARTRKKTRDARRPTRCPRCDGPLKASDWDASGSPKVNRRQLERELLELSPLTLLAEPDRAGRLAEGDDAALQALLAPLFVGDRAVLLSYLDTYLANCWLAEEERRRRLPPAEAQESYVATIRTLNAYLKAAAKRPDALRPLVVFYEEFVVRRFGGRAPVIEALRRQAQGFDRASEREAFLRTASGLFALGRQVTRVVEDALATPFVDRTEEEKVLLADYHERFRDVGPEVEATRRELAGEIG